MTEVLSEETHATISSDGLYRYDLTRRWDDGPLACWIMLNPSKADATEDDPTIRRVRAFTKREIDKGWEIGGFVVVNLFALRVTRPVHLSHHPDPVGPETDRYILEHFEKALLIVAAWGTNGKQFGRDREVLDLLKRKVLWPEMFCLDVTNEGYPRHPLYVRGEQELVSFQPESSEVSA